MSKRNWKKNIRKLPQRLTEKLKSIDSQEIVAGVLKIFRQDEIKKGILSHLQIELTTDGLTYPNEIIPPAKIGKYSNRNCDGYIIKRKDLGITTIGYRTVEVPNYGDSWKGTHEVDLPIKGYPKEHVSPTYYAIKIECINIKPNQSEYCIKFEIDHVLNKKTKHFNNDLLSCLNILQENVGACGIEKAGISIKDYLKTINVSWEILPPGETDTALQIIFARKRPTSKQIKDTKERLEFFRSLKPEKIVIGTSGFNRYFGALINPELVVFDNTDYGNAVYVMFQNWEELSKRTKTELLSGTYGKDFEKIIHSKGWEKMIGEIITQRTNGK